jgi:putative CocE/NonD family hydrolase
MRSSSSSSSGKSSPPKSGSRLLFSSARGAAIATLTLLLSGGCGASDAAGETEAETAGLATEAAAERNRPAPPPEYSASDLQAFAESPEVANLNEPWKAAAPAPDQSLHVTMSDGTRRAVSLYFPSGFDASVSRAPVVYIEAWYGRAVEATGTAIDLYRAAGFVVAISDLRGVGASFGSLPAFMTSEVRREQRELIAWLASQPWSNGKVAAEGFSISATYAEAMAASGAPALQAAIIRASDFDQYANNVFPGGLPNPRMMGLVAEVTEWMRGEPCIADLSICGAIGIAPVDGDTDFRLLQAAFLDHQSNLRGETLASVIYKDDALGTGTVGEMSPVGSVDQLRMAAIPARISASWLDGATAESALARFKALPDVRMEVSIGATAHSGGVDADPFSRKPFQAARPGAAEQYAADVSFVQRALAGEAIGRSVSYYVLGAGVWKTTGEWPPAGVNDRMFQLSRNHIVANTTRIKPGERTYAVDPTTSSGGPFNRWGSQGGMPVYYGDRRAAPGRRLSFDSFPVERDTELVGAPELCLAMRTDQPDGFVFAYLEDVAPDGRVTHLTEGELRLLHRKTQGNTNTQPSGCDPAPGTKRSFNRADGVPVTPGELMYVELPLLPTAALIQKGHRVRLSLAGADEGTFSMLTDTPATWVVSYGGSGGSTLKLPSRPWSQR